MCVYLCVYIQTYMHVYTYMHTYLCMYVYLSVHTTVMAYACASCGGIWCSDKASSRRNTSEKGNRCE